MRQGKTVKIALRTAMVALGSLALLGGVGWLGLQVRPAPYPPHPEKTRGLGTVELPSDLPEPVARYFRVTLGEEVPRVDTAVVWGRGEFNLNGLWFPMRFKSYHVAGLGFRRDMELTWFGVPIFRGYDAYVGGKGTLKFTGLFGLLEVADSGERIDQGDNLVMWAEAPFTTPPALALDRRVRWEPIDDASARLVVPFEGGEEPLRVAFDPKTGMMTRMSGMRYRNQERTRTPYRGEYSDWKLKNRMRLPHRPVAVWEDRGEPYAVLDLEGAEYNVDVSEKVPDAGHSGSK